MLSNLVPEEGTRSVKELASDNDDLLQSHSKPALVLVSCVLRTVYGYNREKRVLTCPLRSCLATTLASLPRRWPFPSMTRGAAVWRDIYKQANQYELVELGGVTYGAFVVERSQGKERKSLLEKTLFLPLSISPTQLNYSI